MTSIRWTPEEDKILRDYYPVEGSDCFKRISTRTAEACRNRVKLLKIRYDKYAYILPNGKVYVRTNSSFINFEPEMQFGYLKLVRPLAERSKYGQILWECRCACGKLVIASQISLRKGDVKSCGCKRKDFRQEYLKSSEGQAYMEQNKKEFNYRTGGVKGTNASVILSSKLNVRNTTGVKGVQWSKQRNKFFAIISFRKKSYHLGFFDDIEDAAKARKAAEEKLAPLLHDILDECKEEIVKMRMEDLKKELKDNSK